MIRGAIVNYINTVPFLWLRFAGTGSVIPEAVFPIGRMERYGEPWLGNVSDPLFRKAVPDAVLPGRSSIPAVRFFLRLLI